jgi:hypothetical protein
VILAARVMERQFMRWQHGIAREPGSVRTRGA